MPDVKMCSEVVFMQSTVTFEQVEKAVSYTIEIVLPHFHSLNFSI